jgi:hypothetical protein
MDFNDTCSMIAEIASDILVQCTTNLHHPSIKMLDCDVQQLGFSRLNT